MDRLKREHPSSFVPDNIYIGSSDDQTKHTLSVSLLRLLVHSTQGPDMKTPDGWLVRLPRTYDSAFLTQWEAKFGSLALSNSMPNVDKA
jgi:hypothetical protein